MREGESQGKIERNALERGQKKEVSQRKGGKTKKRIERQKGGKREGKRGM